jgi:two-component system, sensor histidine kinase PdtaS
MDVAQAVPVALIVVEALTNSLKHAFPEGRSGRIDVRLKRRDDSVLVSIADDGVGLPAAEARQRTSGLRLMEGLARQLRGTLETDTTEGTRFNLCLPTTDEVAPDTDRSQPCAPAALAD